MQNDNLTWLIEYSLKVLTSQSILLSFSPLEKPFEDVLERSEQFELESVDEAFTFLNDVADL